MERDCALTADCVVHAKKPFENVMENDDGGTRNVGDVFEGMENENGVMATGGEVERVPRDLNDGRGENENAMVCGESVNEANGVEAVGASLERKCLLLWVLVSAYRGKSKNNTCPLPFRRHGLYHHEVEGDPSHPNPVTLVDGQGIYLRLVFAMYQILGAYSA